MTDVGGDMALAAAWRAAATVSWRRWQQIWRRKRQHGGGAGENDRRGGSIGGWSYDPAWRAGKCRRRHEMAAAALSGQRRRVAARRRRAAVLAAKASRAAASAAGERRYAF